MSAFQFSMLHWLFVAAVYVAANVVRYWRLWSLRQIAMPTQCSKNSFTLGYILVLSPDPAISTKGSLAHSAQNIGLADSAGAE